MTSENKVHKTSDNDAKPLIIEPQIFSLEQYEQRIKQSINDAENGRLTDADDLFLETKSW